MAKFFQDTSDSDTPSTVFGLPCPPTVNGNNPTLPECPICFEQPVDPVITPCAHIGCLICFSQTVNMCVDNNATCWEATSGLDCCFTLESCQPLAVVSRILISSLFENYAAIFPRCLTMKFNFLTRVCDV